MITLENLMKMGDDLIERTVIPGSPDWEALHDSTPDDVEDDEDGQMVAAADVQTEKETVDRLADSVLEDLTGVTREWLTPVRPAFERLAALAMSKNVTDADFLAALEKAQRDMPELFDKLNSEALETAFENAIGSAMLAGSVKRYEENVIAAANTFNPNQPRIPSGSENAGQWTDGANAFSGSDLNANSKPELIEVDPNNVEFSESDQDREKIDSIKDAYGSDEENIDWDNQPRILLTSDEYGVFTVRDGHHRATAFQELGFRKVPSIVMGEDLFKKMEGEIGVSGVGKSVSEYLDDYVTSEQESYSGIYPRSLEDFID